MNFKHGDRVKCTIDGTEIDDAKISIDEDGTPFICQDDERGGCAAEENFGYKYQWILDEDFTDPSVTNLRLAEKSFDSPEIGDEYINQNGESQVVLGVAGRVIFLSSVEDKDYFILGVTKERLIEFGYTIVQDEPEKPAEMTIEEIEKLVGKKVKIVEKK